MNGLWSAGEAACNGLHGANRLGANSTSECLVWGSITGRLASDYAEKKKDMTLSIADNKIQVEEKRIFDGIFRGRGQVNPYDVRKEFTDLMDVKAYIFRNENDLVQGLNKVREPLKNLTWKHVDDSAKEYNTNFIKCNGDRFIIENRRNNNCRCIEQARIKRCTFQDGLS